MLLVESQLIGRRRYGSPKRKKREFQIRNFWKLPCCRYRNKRRYLLNLFFCKWENWHTCTPYICFQTSCLRFLNFGQAGGWGHFKNKAIAISRVLLLEKMWKCEKMWKMSKTCENLWKLVKTWENLGNLWKLVKTCENLWKLVKTCEKC